MDRPEILAPGGSVESIYSAMNAGCDAVYMGGKRFGARAFADNPDNDGLLNIIDQVHVQGRKLYLTVNTVLGNDEFKSLYEYLSLVYRQGVDAVIVQDMGVLGFIHREFPDLAVHASTQMSIVQASAANLLVPYGVTRVVPARELSFDELRHLRADTDVELEVFVHGALCCSYSGQCLMSSLIGGRSGNKGACAQPCRKMYSYGGGKPAYELSLKDLCTLEYMPEMIEAGVNSFKIEGRMKKPEYVAVTTYMYKKYMGYYFELGKEGYKEFIRSKNEYKKDLMTLKDIYNRGGFTAGYLINDVVKSKMMTENRPNHEGVIVGKILVPCKSSHGQISIVFNENVNAQDILELRNEKGETVHEHTLKDSACKGSKINIKTGYNYNKIDSKCLVYRVRNNSLIDGIREKFPSSIPMLVISGSLKAVAGEPLELSIWTELDNRKNIKSYRCTSIGNIVNKAQKHVASENEVRRKIMVTGSSNFVWKSLEILLGEDVFLSPSELKIIRRQAFQQLLVSIIAGFRRNTTDKSLDFTNVDDTVNKGCSETNLQNVKRTSASEIITECRNSEQFNVLDKLSINNTIYLHIEDMEMKELSDIIDRAHKDIFLVLPRLFRWKNQQYFDDNYSMEKLTEMPAVKGVVACNLEQIAWLHRHGYLDNIIMRTADNLYVRNYEAYALFKALGAEGCSSSVEMSESELDKLPECNADILVYGRPSAMIMANRFDNSGVLKDSYSNEYLIVDHKLTKYCEILHYEPINSLNKFEKYNNKRIRLLFTVENAKETNNVLKYFNIY